MFIQTEQTPNPQTLKFLPGRAVIKEGTAFYKNESEALDSPLAKKLFSQTFSFAPFNDGFGLGSYLFDASMRSPGVPVCLTIFRV